MAKKKKKQRPKKRPVARGQGFRKHRTPKEALQLADQSLCQGRFGEAVQLYQLLLNKDPDLVPALHGLGIAAHHLGHSRNALELISRAAELSPESIEIMRNRGVVAMSLGYKERGLEHLLEALALNPEDPNSIRAVGTGYSEAHKFVEGAEYSKRAVELFPEDIAALYAYATCLARLCHWEELKTIKSRLFAQLEGFLGTGAVPPITPLGLLLLNPPLALQGQMAHNFAGSMSQQRLVPTRPEPHPEGKLRIGYISADLSEHAVGFLLSPILQHHNQDEFEIYGFSLRAAKGRSREKIEAACHKFYSLDKYSDEAAARFIQQKNIHVLVDLGGATDGARPRILGYRPAPVQAHYLGYPGTVSHKLVDYMVTHKTRDPIELFENYYSEAIVYLEDWLGTGGWEMPDLPARENYHLPEDHFVFCYFSAAYRIEETIFTCWMKVLEAVPKSVMWLPEYQAETQESLRQQAERQGIDPNRLVFCKETHLSENWHHRHADLWLDALHPSSGTAGVLAAWANLPMLTVAGDSPQDRTGALVMDQAGLSEAIVQDLDSYVQTAIAWAQDPQKTKALKAKLEASKETAPLFQPQRACKSLEKAYLQMWRKFEKGEQARHFSI